MSGHYVVAKCQTDTAQNHGVNYFAVGQSIFPASSTPAIDAALLAEFGICQKKEAKLLRRYLRALKAKKSVSETQEEYLNSAAVKFAVAVAMTKKRPAYARSSLEELHSAPSGLDFSKPIPEIVKLFLKPKTSGVGVRPICDCGPINRTAQNMAVNLLKPCFTPALFQYDSRKANVRSAVLAFIDLIEQGYCWVQHDDAKDFFGSIEAPELPLPKAVVEHVILGRHANIKLTGKVSHPYTVHNNNKIKAQARRGILQGAASSPLVAAMVVSRLNWIAPTDVALISFVDDFYLVAKSAGALNDAADALRTAFQVLPGGHYHLHTKGAARHVKDGVAMLGHLVTAYGGKTTIEWTNANATIAEERIEENEKHATLFAQQYVKFSNPQCRWLALDAIGRLWGTEVAWAKAFELCLGVKDQLKVVEYAVIDLAQQCGFSLDEVNAAAAECGGWKWGSG